MTIVSEDYSPPLLDKEEMVSVISENVNMGDYERGPLPSPKHDHAEIDLQSLTILH